MIDVIKLISFVLFLIFGIGTIAAAGAAESHKSDIGKCLFVGLGLFMATGISFWFLMSAFHPAETVVMGKGSIEILDSHKLVSLDSDTSVTGRTGLTFGYIAENDDYVVMVEQEDGGYRKERYRASQTTVYEDVDEKKARVDEVEPYEDVRETFRFPIIGEISQNRRKIESSEMRIHVPVGSIRKSEYNVN